MAYEIAQDSEDLLYYARRGAEKQYQLADLRAQTHGIGALDPKRIPIIQQALEVQSKYEITKSDFDDILERYAGKVAIVAPITHVKPKLTEADSDLVTVEGTITHVDYAKAIFKVATDSGPTEVQYADFVLHAGCTHPSPQDAIELELVSPTQ